MKKSDITDIDRQIYALAVECAKSALPKAKTHNRNSNGMPLTFWMGAITNGSKILGVIDDNKRQPPAGPMRIGIENIVDRVLKKNTLTVAQADCVIDVFSSRYRGWPNYVSERYTIPANVLLCEGFSRYDLYDIKATPKAPRMPITLKFLLSDQLTDLILLKCLYLTIVKAKNATNKPTHIRR